MRKNINKIVVFAIGISVISGSIIPAFAADNVQTTQSTYTINAQTNQKTVLTLDDAIKSAISISDKLELDDKKITYQDKTNDIKEKRDDFNNVSCDVENYKNDTNDINLKIIKQQRDFNEDILRKKVYDKYNDIVSSQVKINKADKELEIKNKGLENDNARVSLGMITESAYNTEVVNSEQSDLDLRAEVINYNIIKEKVQKPWIEFSN